MSYNIIMLEPIVNKVHKSLIEKNKTVSVAESCTAGLLSFMLTRFSGSSKYYSLGIISYSNKAKEDILKIPHSVISKHGAVSQITARRMAQGVRRIAKTDIGVGITGIAGPTGATPKKPIGTVFIAINAKKKTICKEFLFSGNRDAIIRKVTLKALALLQKSI